MHLSFNLDSTLLSQSGEFHTDPQSFWAMLFRAEPLREGTVELMQKLKQQGHQISIYTDSRRSPFQIRKTFRMQGIKLYLVINQQMHEQALGSKAAEMTKFPTAFGIHLHIDHIQELETVAEKWRFRTLILSPSDRNWTAKVLAEVNRPT